MRFIPILLVTVLLSCFTTSKINNKKPIKQITLAKNILVYKNNNFNSPVVSILPQGKRIKIYSIKKDWYLTAINGFERWIYQPLKKNPYIRYKKNHYPYVSFSIPKRGSQSFRVMKINEKYYVNITKANGKKVFERISKIENVEFKLPSNISPITYKNSGISYSSLKNDLIENASLSINNTTLTPQLWPTDSIKRLANSSIRIAFPYLHDYPMHNYENNYPEKISSYFFGKSYHNYFYCDNAYFYKLNKFRKIEKKVSFNQVVETKKTAFSITPIQGIVSPNGHFKVIIASAVGSDEKYTFVYFLNNNFKVIKIDKFLSKKIIKIDFSSYKMFCRLTDSDDDSSPEKRDVIYNFKFNKIYSRNTNLKKLIFYTPNLNNRVTFNHNQIIVLNTRSKQITLSNQTPVEFRSSWLIDTSNNYITSAMGSKLYTMNLKNGRIQSSYQLSSSYKFINLSNGRFALLSNNNTGGTWSIIDLRKKRIITTKYKGDLFSETPNTLLSFPSNDYILIHKKNTSLNKLVFCDLNGRIYKTRIFKSSKNVIDIKFLNKKYIEIRTSNDIYIFPIYKILQTKIMNI